MQVSEIFYSIQGEGPNLGKPAIFLRTAGCHLRCVWCDSKFTWDRKSGKKMETSEIVKKIKSFPCKHLIITGGEPLLQQSAIIELCKKLKGYYIEIETSGSLKSHIDEYVNHYNCSPKLSNSKNRRIHLEKFPKDSTAYKFVVDTKADLKEIKAFIKKYKLPNENIVLMPQGVKKREIAERSKWLVELCKENNFRFSPRLHINIWGNKRKV